MGWNASLPANSSLIRLSAGYIRDNESAVQSVLTQTNLENNTPYIPNTHPVWFYADTAPTGWTILGGVTDVLLAVKGGTSQYNTTGGTLAGTWVGPGVALTRGQVRGSGGGSGAYSDLSSSGPINPPASHSHDWTSTRPSGAVGILCQKNV